MYRIILFIFAGSRVAFVLWLHVFFCTQAVYLVSHRSILYMASKRAVVSLEYLTVAATPIRSFCGYHRRTGQGGRGGGQSPPLDLGN